MSYLSQNGKPIPLVQFFINKENRIEVSVNENLYKNKEQFNLIVANIKDWADFQIPNLEETISNYKKSTELIDPSL